MPVFICEFCNETLKRNKVEQHSYTCRGCWVLSCMDCNARFEGNEYLAHTSCVTEAERYQGALYVAKENKGEAKQEAWSSSVQSKVDKASAELRPFAEKLLAYDNVPRKKAKFINFVKNSLNLKQDPKGIADQLWELIGDAAPPGPSAEAIAAQEAAAKAKAAEAAEAAEAAKAARERLEAKDKAKADAANDKSTKDKVISKEEQDAKSAKEERKAAKAAKAEAKAAKAEAKAAAVTAAAVTAEASTAEASTAAATSDDAGQKRKRGDAADAPMPSDTKPVKAPGKRQKGAPQEIDTATKPIKWKAIITKELQSEGGSMSLKNLRKATVAEVSAHPSYSGRKAKQIKEEFDAVLPTFNKYKVVEGRVSMADLE